MSGAVFRYTAKDAAGASRKGVISAPSEAEAAQLTSFVHDGRVHAPQDTQALLSAPPQALRDYL